MSFINSSPLRRFSAVLLVALLCTSAALLTPRLEPSSARGARIPVLILTGNNRTDWRWTSTHLRGLLEASGKFDVEISVAPEGMLADPYYLERFELFLVDYAGPRWGELAETNFLNAVREGTGVVTIGNAVAAFQDWKEYEELVGFHCKADAYRENFQEVHVSFTSEEHPIAKGYGGLGAHSDQLAVGLELVAEKDHEVIATVASTGGGEPQPALLVGKYGEGRVFATPLGHVSLERMQTWVAHQNPRAEELFLRACEWAASGKVTGLRRLAPNTLTEGDKRAGWRLLFDGTTPKGWGGVTGGFPAERWNAEGGVLRVLPDADSGGIATVEEYREFELELEWKVEGDGGSSLKLLGGGGAGSSLELGSEAADYGSDASARYVLRPVGEFNHARVVATYGSVEHWLNGVKIATFYDDPAGWARRMTEGNVAGDAELRQLPLARISLSDGGADVCFRNIKIRRLPLATTEAAPKQPATPKVALFNGHDLEGWSWYPEVEPLSAPGAFQVSAEGLLIGTGLPAGQLRTQKTYKDYELTLDWRFKPENTLTGKGGVYLRTTGDDVRFPKGIEVKLGYKQVGAMMRYGGYEVALDPRRQNGDYSRPISDMEHPPGEWNQLVVRLKGGELLVRVNGEVVNVASQAEEQPGVIGLVTYGIEFQFRNLLLRPLN